MSADAQNDLVTAISVSMGDAAEFAGVAVVRVPVVVIGASAGGVEALRTLFAAMPSDTGASFVVVTHLAPDRVSMLSSIIGAVTSMPTSEIKTEMSLEPDRIYVAPPGQFVEATASGLRLQRMVGRTPKPTGIDRCMISLAATRGDHVVGVVLTGADGDGVVGCKAIKSEGGFVIVQTPETARSPDMPLGAIATGSVDVQANVPDIPAHISEYLSTLRRLDASAEAATLERLLSTSLALVHRKLGLDFHAFKRAMLRRRLQRRVALAHSSNVTDYGALLERGDAELRALAEDFLINVTEFFREPDSWDVLEREFVPDLLRDHPIGGTVRVWVPACSTGEEAYTIGMVLHDCPIARERDLHFQIFATDVDAHALATARRGIYSENITPAISPIRLQRYFVKTASGYAVRPALRETILFAVHNLLQDPPFSRIDLISCRNLLIYLNADAQRRALQTMHFALNEDGMLSLGKSESTAAFAAGFVDVSERSRLYRRSGSAKPRLSSVRQPELWRADVYASHNSRVPQRSKLTFAVADSLLDRPGQVALAADANGHVLHVSSGMAEYLSFPEGQPTDELFALLPTHIRPRLRIMFQQALRTRGVASREVDFPMRGNGTRVLRMHVEANSDATAWNGVIVRFEPSERAPEPEGTTTINDEEALSLLDEELRRTKEELRGVIDELELANQQLTVANEEAMSMNEELQSSNEELETSKEELQSINEELTSVNEQLHEKIGQLERVNDDIGNLLVSTNIATIFLDRELRIKRFTSAATEVFRLLPSDIDRPISDLASHGGSFTVVEDARTVLATFVPQQRETQTPDGEFFLTRTLPYRTRDDRVEGVVITFTNITPIRKATDSLRRLALVIENSTDAIVTLDADGRVVTWNVGAQTMLGYPAADVAGTMFELLVPSQLREQFRETVRGARAGARTKPIETERVARDGSVRQVSSTVFALPDTVEAGAIALIDRDITAQLEARHALLESEQRFRSLADDSPVLIFQADSNGILSFVNKEFESFLGRQRSELVGSHLDRLFHTEDRHNALLALRSTEPIAELTARMPHSSGSSRWLKLIARRNDGGWIGSLVDIHVQIASESALRESAERKDEFLAMLGHELRNPLAPIRNAAEILTRINSEDPRIAWVCGLLQRQVEHMTKLVDDLLDISRISRGNLRITLAPVDLRTAITFAIETLDVIIRRKKHTLHVDLGNAPVLVLGDAIRLTQLFENLVLNAAKYTDEGGELQVSLQRGENTVAIVVEDNGVGISREMLARIFDVFVQDSRSIDRSQGGIGIGLALVRHLAELHGGNVVASSPGVGKGARFTVTLPLGSAETVSAAVVDAVPATNGQPTSGRILVVDDDADAGQSLAEIARMLGHTVAFASTLQDALSTASRLIPQIVLMDIAMPGADGYEIASQLRRLPVLPPDTAFIAVTGFSGDKDVDRSKAAGFAHHLVKPIDSEVLDAVLQRILSHQPS